MVQLPFTCIKEKNLVGGVCFVCMHVGRWGFEM